MRGNHVFIWHRLIPYSGMHNFFENIFSLTDIRAKTCRNTVLFGSAPPKRGALPVSATLASFPAIRPADQAACSALKRILPLRRNMPGARLKRRAARCDQRRHPSAHSVHIPLLAVLVGNAFMPLHQRRFTRTRHTSSISSAPVHQT